MLPEAHVKYLFLLDNHCTRVITYNNCLIGSLLKFYLCLKLKSYLAKVLLVLIPYRDDLGAGRKERDLPSLIEGRYLFLLHFCPFKKNNKSLTFTYFTLY